MARNQFSGFSEKPNPGSECLAKNHSLIKTELTKKIMRVSPAIPEESFQTYTQQTSSCFSIEIYIYNHYAYVSQCNDQKYLFKYLNTLKTNIHINWFSGTCITDGILKNMQV